MWPSISCQLDHLARRILARAVPADDGPCGEGVSQIMDARPATMAPEPLCRSKPRRWQTSAKLERALQSSGRSPCSRREEGLRTNRAAGSWLVDIGSQALCHAAVHRHQPSLAQLAPVGLHTPISRSTSSASSARASLILRPVVVIEAESVEKVCPRSQIEGRPGCGGDDVGDLIGAVDMGERRARCGSSQRGGTLYWRLDRGLAATARTPGPCRGALPRSVGLLDQLRCHVRNRLVLMCSALWLRQKR